MKPEKMTGAAGGLLLMAVGREHAIRLYDIARDEVFWASVDIDGSVGERVRAWEARSRWEEQEPGIERWWGFADVIAVANLEASKRIPVEHGYLIREEAVCGAC